MIAGTGGLEKEAALRRLESTGRIVGPALVVSLSSVIGLMKYWLPSGASRAAAR
jgi:hypothetical protein